MAPQRRGHGGIGSPTPLPLLPLRPAPARPSKSYASYQNKCIRFFASAWVYWSPQVRHGERIAGKLTR
jgi:hypothetical protein